MIQLFQHQRKAFDQTEGFNRCAYYLDMGLGKTYVGSEKMDELGEPVNLLICQCSKIDDWIEHFQTYYPGYQLYDCTKPKQLKAFLEADNDTKRIGVINYELTFRRKKLAGLQDFTLMLDESSLIQNEQAQRSKFILKLNPKNVILLSGTPTGGKYEKLWSQCKLLGWKISKELFYKQYVKTEWVEEDGFFRQRIIGYKNVDRLKMKLAQHGAVFMTTEDAGIDLPPKNFIPVHHPAPPTYREFMKKRVIEIDTASLGEFEEDSDFWGSNLHCRKELIGDTPLTRRLYARQLCGMYNKARYQAFRDLVDSTDDRLLVFYNFTDEMNFMLKYVKDRPVSILNGETKDLTAYRHKSNSITFIQYQAGSRGGNYQLANKIIYFSLPQEWELYEQSQKRIHRIGQDHPCFYYLMMCPGSVEEHVLATLKLRKDYNDELFEDYEKTQL